jgi:hypothetical protein
MAQAGRAMTYPRTFARSFSNERLNESNGEVGSLRELRCTSGKTETQTRKSPSHPRLLYRWKTVIGLPTWFGSQGSPLPTGGEQSYPAR